MTICEAYAPRACVPPCAKCQKGACTPICMVMAPSSSRTDWIKELRRGCLRGYLPWMPWECNVAARQPPHKWCRHVWRGSVALTNSAWQARSFVAQKEWTNHEDGSEGSTRRRRFGKAPFKIKLANYTTRPPINVQTAYTFSPIGWPMRW